MLARATIEDIAGRLYFYDVVQGGWKHESRGFEFNAHHVLSELVNNLFGKNFEDPNVVQTAIAPDSLQYALRLGRWTEQQPKCLDSASAGFDGDNCGWLATRSLESLPRHQAVFAHATLTVSRNLHDLDDEDKREDAIARRPEDMRQAAGMLLYCAGLQAGQYSFGLLEAFDARLAYLRERFGIPVPSA